MPRPSPIERARAYIQKSAPPAIQGSRGDDTTYAVACALVIEFALTDDEAWDLLVYYNTSKCSPPWTEKDLTAKLRSARMMARSKPHEVGRLLDADKPSYTGPSGRSPANTAPARASTKPQTGPPVKRPPVSRTERTPLFTVHKAGQGAEPRTRRTLRTLVSYSLTQTINPQSSCIDKKEPSEVYSETKPPVSEEQPTQAKPGPALGIDRVYDSIDAFARSSAQESGNEVTILMKESGRIVKVRADGSRKLMGQEPPEL